MDFLYSDYGEFLDENRAGVSMFDGDRWLDAGDLVEVGARKLLYELAGVGRH